MLLINVIYHMRLEIKMQHAPQLPSTPPPRIAQTAPDKHLQSLNRRNGIGDVLPLVDLELIVALPQCLALGQVLEIRGRGEARTMASLKAVVAKTTSAPWTAALSEAASSTSLGMISMSFATSA
jgi:hypothetical protein